MCVCVWTPAWCLLCAVFPAATFAGATCELCSLGVIKILYKAILEPHTGFNVLDCVCRCVFVPFSECVHMRVCMSLC